MGGGWGGDQMVMVPMSMLQGGFGGGGKGWGGKGWGKKGGASDFARRAPVEKKVWVGGFEAGKEMSADLNKKLKEHLGDGCKYAEVGRKGCGTALFQTEEQATNAIATLNGSSFEGVSLQLDVWEKMPKTDKTE